ncbi:MAG: DUF5696 domain-containing protein [bacterium]
MTQELTNSGTITLFAGNSTIEIDSQGRLAFCLSGQRQWEAKSLCILHYYDRQHPRAQQVLVPWDDSQAFGTMGTLSLSTRSKLDIQKINDCTAAIVITCDTIHMKITLSIEMDASGEGFDIAVTTDGVNENHSRLYRLLGLEILPEFGAARTGEQGYLTLPNWHGCQTFFDKAYPREVWQTIYSSNDQWENVCNAPVFGITRTQGTLCGLVTEGDEDAQLVCRRHWEAAQANSVHPYFVWRWAQEDDVIAGPRRMRYRFAHPNCPQGEGYAFVGVQYRTFLRSERGVQNWIGKGKTRPEAIDYAGRFFLKIFMAYKDPHPEGKGDYHCTCTCDEAREIIRQCLERGMKKLTVILVGWGQDGHDGKPPTYLPVDERVGGENRMKELIAWCKEYDVMLGVHTSHNAAYPCSDEFSVDDLVRHRSGEYWESIVWSGGQAHRVCPTISLNKHVKRDLPALARLGFYGHHHYDAVGGFVCCYSSEHPVRLRSQYMELIRQECRVAQDTMGSLSTEMPYGQYFSVMDGFFHSFSNPSGYLRNCGIGRYFLDRSVPMIGIALHGSHNCGESIGTADDNRLMRMLDLGLTPQFEVCMRPSPAFGIPAYQTNAEFLQKAYSFAFGQDGYMTKLTKYDIDGRWEPAQDVSKTLYSNGTAVVVNFSNKDFDGIPAGEYRVFDGNHR